MFLLSSQGLALFLLVNSSSSYMSLPIDEIYDGDTIKTHISDRRLPSPLNELSIRINGIDTPEMPAKSFEVTGKLGRAQCREEALHALKAKKYLERLLKDKKYIRVYNFEWGKFGGRIVGDIKVNNIPVSKYLIDAKLAVPYDGTSKTYNWCKELKNTYIIKEVNKFKSEGE